MEAALISNQARGEAPAVLSGRQEAAVQGRQDLLDPVVRRDPVVRPGLAVPNNNLKINYYENKVHAGFASGR